MRSRKHLGILLLAFGPWDPPSQAAEITIDAAANVGPSSAIKDFLAHQGGSLGDESDPVYRFINDAWREVLVGISDVYIFGIPPFPEFPGILVSTQSETMEMDFRGLDNEIDGYLARIRPERIQFAIALMPRALSSCPENETRWQYCPPRDYAQWSEAVRRAVEYIKNGRGGRFAGASYVFWAEPDSGTYWLDSMDEYVEMYVHTWRGMKAADPAAKLGATDAMTPTSAFTEEFLRKLSEYNALQAPERRVALDEVVWQDFNWPHTERLSDGVSHIRGLLVQNGFPAATPLVVIGWNNWGNPPSSCEGYSLQKRASFFASNIIRELNPGETRGLSRAYIWPFAGDFAIDDFISHLCRNSGIITTPDPNDSTATYCKRPAFAALQMLKSMTGGHFVAVTTSSFDSSSLFQVLAAQNESSAVSLLLANHSEIQEELALLVRNLPYGTTFVNQRIQRIDQNHSADCAGLEAGISTQLPLVDGAVRFQINAPAHSVALITLSRPASRPPAAPRNLRILP